MDLSFVIPAHDEEAYLPATIAAIRESMRGVKASYEIIVAADGCTDSTVLVAQSHGATVVEHQRRQIAATRNLGGRAATGRWIVFVDADTQVTPNAIAEMMTILQRGAVGGGGLVRLDGPLPFYAKIMMPPLIALFRVANLAGGAFLFCTRDAFISSGGFDETYYAGEEIFFAKSLKRLGRFRLTRSNVVTSGRKVRTFSARELCALLVLGLLKPSTMKSRAKLDFFYGPRRADPHINRPH